jgi:hypothetical protein
MYLVEFHIDGVEKQVSFTDIEEAEKYYRTICERHGIGRVRLRGAGGGIIRENGRVYGN